MTCRNLVANAADMEPDYRASHFQCRRYGSPVSRRIRVLCHYPCIGNLSLDSTRNGGSMRLKIFYQNLTRLAFILLD